MVSSIDMTESMFELTSLSIRPMSPAKAIKNISPSNVISKNLAGIYSFGV